MKRNKALQNLAKPVIRKEEYRDFKSVSEVIEKAFEAEPTSDHKEHFLVERLRKSDAFIPELSMVAEIDNKIVGHILLTRLTIHNGRNTFDSLALAPVSVLPEYQGRGVGAMLIRKAHAKAKVVGHQSVILLGHEKYYPRFGYKPASRFRIELPFEVPNENCMAIELVEDGLKGVSGVVEYPKEFYE